VNPRLTFLFDKLAVPPKLSEAEVKMDDGVTIAKEIRDDGMTLHQIMCY